jgi:hypothetical protein
MEVYLQYSAEILGTNSLFTSESVTNATNYFFPPLLLETQHVSALDGHLQVSQYAETATLHQCALKSHTL